MKRMSVLIVVLLVIFVFIPSVGSAQSMEQANNLIYEGEALLKAPKAIVDIQTAHQKLTSALAICEKIKSNQGKAVDLLDTGRLYEYSGQYRKAIDYYEKSLAILRKSADGKSLGVILDFMGRIYYLWHEDMKAMERYEQALLIHRKIGNVRGECIALNNIGVVYGRMGQCSMALEHYEKSLVMQKTMGGVNSEWSTLNNIGFVHSDLGQHQRALGHHGKALVIHRKMGEMKDEWVILDNIAGAHMDLGQYSKALEQYDKSLAISGKLRDVKGEGTTLNNIGRVYSALGQYSKALEYYKKSLVITSKIGDTYGEDVVLNNIGNIYVDLGQYSKALEQYNRSLVFRRKVRDLWGEGATLNCIGEVYGLIGKYHDALASFKKGLEVSAESRVPAYSTRKLIGELYLDRGELDKASEWIKDASSTQSLRLNLSKSKYVEAQQGFEYILALAESDKDADALFTAYTGLGFAYEGMSDNNKAMDNFAKAVSLTEDLRDSLPREQRETFFDVRINGFLRTTPYDGLARVLMKLNKLLEALEESEYTKARVFAEALSKRAEESVPLIPKETMDADSQLHDQLSALTKNLQSAYEKRNGEAIAILEAQVKQAKEKLATHTDMLRKQYPLFAATKYPQPMALSQADLKDNEWVLAYHVTDLGIIIYLTRGKNLVKAEFKPVPRKEIDDLVRKLRASFEMTGEGIGAATLAKFDFSSGKKLSDILLADILPDLPKDTPVIIIPDGSLG
ncbi:MAG: tetratricopeptide repeat protein, partial [Desulfomonilaceae bacterium]